MPSRNKNFIILPKSWSGHGRTDRTGSAGPASVQQYVSEGRKESYSLITVCHNYAHSIHMHIRTDLTGSDVTKLKISSVEWFSTVIQCPCSQP